MSIDMGLLYKRKSKCCKELKLCITLFIRLPSENLYCCYIGFIKSVTISYTQNETLETL